MFICVRLSIPFLSFYPILSFTKRAIPKSIVQFVFKYLKYFRFAFRLFDEMKSLAFLCIVQHNIVLFCIIFIVLVCLDVCVGTGAVRGCV